MKFRSASAFLIVMVLFSGISLRAQQPAPESETLSATTELVLVPVQVKGHDGKPLLGLKQEDFVLRSDGKPQTIRVFEQTTQNSPMAANRPAAQTSPLSNKISNVPETGMPDRIFIVALDLVNTAFLDQTRAKQELLKYLEQEPNQRFALVAITKDGLAQIHNFSSDPAVLVEALKRVQNSQDKDLADQPALDSMSTTWQFASECRPIDEYTSLTNAYRDSQVYGGYAQKLAAHATLTALKQVAQAYAGVPGRKSVIWLTGGMPVLLYDAFAGGAKGNSALNGDPEMLSEYDEAFTALNNANIAIYGVDVKGIKQDRTYHATGMNQAMHHPQDQVRAAGNVVSPLGYNDEAIQVLSSATGGKSCTANVGVKDCFDQAIADSSSYYMLGFYVPQQDRKPGWHKLDVKLVTERGSVRSRTSYYLASTTLPSDKEINRSLRDAAGARIDYTGLAFTVERQTMGDPPKPAMRVRVPAGSVLMTAGHPQLSYDIVTVPLDNKGEPAGNLRVVRLNLTDEQTQAALSKGWSFVDQPQGSATQAIKYVLRDNGTGHIGSLVVLPQKAGG